MYATVVFPRTTKKRVKCTPCEIPADLDVSQMMDVDLLPSQQLIKQIVEEKTPAEPRPILPAISTLTLNYKQYVAFMISAIKLKHLGDSNVFVPDRVKIQQIAGNDLTQIEALFTVAAQEAVNGIIRLKEATIVNQPRRCSAHAPDDTEEFWCTHQFRANEYESAKCKYANTEQTPLCTSEPDVCFGHPSLVVPIADSVCSGVICEKWVSAITMQIMRIYCTSEMDDAEWSDLTATEKWPLMEFSVKDDTGRVFRTCPFCVDFYSSNPITDGCWNEIRVVAPPSPSPSPSEEESDDSADSFINVPTLIPVQKQRKPAAPRAASVATPKAPRAKKAAAKPAAARIASANGASVLVRPKKRAYKKKTSSEISADCDELIRQIEALKHEKLLTAQNPMRLLAKQA
jgi:hypothetical protein